MTISFNKGIVVDGQIVLDKTARHSVEKAFISHAHADHVNLAGENEIIASRETVELIKALHRKEKKFRVMKKKESISLNGFELTAHDSGHMLGAKQLLMEGKKERILYTGDLNVNGSIIDGKAEAIQADSLIIEATYGLSEYKFPERQVVYDEITEWLEKKTGKNTLVLIPCYNVGKAQELTALISSRLKAGLFVHEKLFKLNKIYEKMGVDLGNYSLLENNLNDADIALLPSSLVRKNLPLILEKTLKRKVNIMNASGQKFFSEKTFMLSSHSDYEELMQFIQDVNPKKVFTVYGHARELAFSVKRKLGIPSVALKQGGFQGSLDEF